MRLSQMLTHLPAAGWNIDRIVLERTASWCLLRKDKRSLMCCDLQAWVPREWATIVADVGAWTDGDAKSLAGPSLPAKQVQIRAETIRDAVLQIFNWIEGENLGAFRPTGSGQSFTAYRRRFGEHRLLVHNDVARLQAERTAMYTGRAEAWRHGALRSGPYVEYDLHAAYATIGRDCEVPTIARGELRSPTIERVRRAMDRFAVLANVTVSTEVECVPFGAGGRTLWPVGTFASWLWDPELKLVFDYAEKVTVNHAYTYVRQPALSSFCTWVISGMEGQTQIYGLLPQRVLKHWSRALVGRFGLRYREWIKFGPLDPPDVRLVTYHDLDDGTDTDMLYAGTSRMLLGDQVEARESMPQIPGWIMSECRRRLWDSMTYVGLEHVVYIDTDSIIVRDYPSFTATFMGRDADSAAWVRKGTYDRMTIHGPRNLEVGHSRRVSGLPLSARQTAPLEFTGEVMRGVKHAMRAGELDRVVSLPRTFHLSAPDLRRQHNPDGSTSPFRIEA